MRIIHTSDWHIGQNFYGYERDDEHRYFFEQLAEIMGRERPDALVVSGDIFHTAVPSAAAQRLFVDGVLMLHDASPNSTIVITAGNHDGASRLEAQSQLWQRLGIKVIGGTRIDTDKEFCAEQFLVNIRGIGVVVAVPYFHPSYYPAVHPDVMREDRQSEFFAALMQAAQRDECPVVMMAHLAVEGANLRGHEDVPVGGMLKDNIDLLGDGYDYLALGHIHMPQRIDNRSYYCGTPLPVSFSEDYDHYVNLVDIQAHGTVPGVTQLQLQLKRGVKTLPPDGGILDEALALLEAMAQTDQSYVRLLVEPEGGPLPADAEDRARKVAQGKDCRFCEIRIKPRKEATKDSQRLKIVEVQDFRSIEPIEVAKRHYRDKIGQDMSQTISEMITKAIEIAQNIRTL